MKPVPWSRIEDEERGLEEIHAVNLAYQKVLRNMSDLAIRINTFSNAEVKYLNI